MPFLYSTLRAIVTVLFGIALAAGLMLLTGTDPLTSSTQLSIPAAGEVPFPTVILWGLGFIALIGIARDGLSDAVAIFLSAIPPLGAIYERGRAKRAERLPSELSRRPFTSGFKSGYDFCKSYLTRLAALQARGGLDKQVVDSLHQSALNNVALLARGILQERPPLGVNANIMHYDSSDDRLIVLTSTDFQSYESIVHVWKLDRDHVPDPSAHEGICVRAFRGRDVVLQPSMASEAVRKDEPIVAMMSIPVADIATVQDGDLASVNINAFVSEHIPKRLSRQQRKRVEMIQELCKELNDLRRSIKAV